jgi:hypothetical protein
VGTTSVLPGETFTVALNYDTADATSAPAVRTAAEAARVIIDPVRFKVRFFGPLGAEVLSSEIISVRSGETSSVVLSGDSIFGGNERSGGSFDIEAWPYGVPITATVELVPARVPPGNIRNRVLRTIAITSNLRSGLSESVIAGPRLHLDRSIFEQFVSNCVSSTVTLEQGWSFFFTVAVITPYNPPFVNTAPLDPTNPLIVDFFDATGQSLRHDVGSLGDPYSFPKIPNLIQNFRDGFTLQNGSSPTQIHARAVTRPGVNADDPAFPRSFECTVEVRDAEGKCVSCGSPSGVGSGGQAGGAGSL